MSGGRFEMGDYVDVAERIRQFRERYPDGSLQPADLAHPYRVEQIGTETVITVVAAAFRSPTDERPGIGSASEPYPGRTPYTRGSELQNAETSAWGRAIVAALAADTRRGVASAEEVRNRRAERAPVPPGERVARARKAIAEAGHVDDLERIARHVGSYVDGGELSEEDAAELHQAIEARLDAPRTNAQSDRIMGHFAKVGLPYRDNKPAALALISEWCGREVDSTKTLTMREAGMVIACLEVRIAEAAAGHDDGPAS